MLDLKKNLLSKKRPLDSRRETASMLDEGSLTERRAFQKSFIKEIKVTDNEVLVTYTMPVMPDGTDHEKGVLDTVNCGGAEGIRTPDPLNANLSFVVSMVYFTSKRVLRCLNAICVLCVECLQVTSCYTACVSYLLAISVAT